MVDSIVSVRMPSSLVQKLKELSKENHFLDVSEELRSIIKVKIHAHTEMIGAKIVEEKAKPADFKSENIVKEELLKRLKKMIKELEHE
jgi:Arc/MetJ-type ribon-helix-helix transcriptional regulator